MPFGFEADDIARDATPAEFGAEVEDFVLGEILAYAIPHAQAPARGNGASAGEEVIALDRLAHGGAGEDVDVGALGFGDFDEDAAGLADVFAAAVEGGVAGGIDEDAIAAGGDVERDGRMRIAGIDFGIGVDAKLLLQAALHEGLELQAQAVDTFVGREREGDEITAPGGLSGRSDGRRGDLRKGIGGGRRIVARGYGGDGFRRAKREFEYAGVRGLGQQGRGSRGGEELAAVHWCLVY